tara:strand:+ start:57 stop:587 length:531 start_codon:yes stop_codon:yes gene_type:complete
MGNNENGHNAINTLILLNELQQLSPASTTAVNMSVPSGEDFSENRAQNLANLVGSISATPIPSYDIEDITMSMLPMAAPVKTGKGLMSFLKGLLGRNKSGYGFPTNLTAHSSIDNLIDADKVSKLLKKKPKVEVSNLLPKDMAESVLPPNPDLTRFILRNDPGRKRILDNLKKKKR